MMRNKTLAYYSIRQQERNLWCIHGMTVWNPFLPVCAELSHNIQNPDLERRLDSINYKMEDCLLSQKTSLFVCDIMVQMEQIEQIIIIYSFTV